MQESGAVIWQPRFVSLVAGWPGISAVAPSCQASKPDNHHDEYQDGQRDQQVLELEA
jgi:hypothetical protein